MRKLLAETDSTNNTLKEWARRETLPNLSWVRAEYQTSGRGQVGNTWESERGKNLLASVFVCGTSLRVSDQFYLSECVALSVTQALDSLSFDGCRVKWPNDIYYADRKLCGILIENTLRGTDIAESIIGIGLNVGQTCFVSDAPNPVSLAQIAAEKKHSQNTYPNLPSPQCVLDAILLHLQANLALLETHLFDCIKKAYMARLWRNDGQFHCFATCDGTHFQARVCDILASGHLILQNSDGKELRFVFKEVEWLKETTNN